MTSDARIDAIQEHLHTLQTAQIELDRQVQEANRDQWRARIEDLQSQVSEAKTSGTDRLKQANESLRGAWDHTCAQVDGASTTASSVSATMRSGLHGAYSELRDALAESRATISR